MTITTLLPNGEQQFFDDNGDPLAGGKVHFYIPQTTIPKSTWQDEDQLVPNTNPVILDAAGRAIIYGAGSYRQVLTDALDNQIWDQETASTNRTQIYVGPQTAGAVNVQTLDVPNYDLVSGNLVLFTFGLTNTSAMTLDISGTGAVPVTKNSSGVQVPLVSGDAVAGAFGAVYYDGTEYQLISVIGTSLEANPLTSIASGATTDIGSTGSTNVQITGTTTITALGASANVNQPLYFVKFTGALLLTYNATSLILPGAANITTAAGDTAFALYLGAGNWQIVQYTVAASSLGNIAGVLPGVIGLRIINNVGVPNTKLDITADRAVLINSGTNGAVAFNTVSATLDFTTVGAGGLDTGAIAANSWYYLYLISDGTTINVLASLSATAPTLPTGFDLVCLVGAWITDGAAALILLIQVGNRTDYLAFAAITSGTVSGAVSVVGVVPTIATEIFIVGVVSPGSSFILGANAISTFMTCACISDAETMAASALLQGTNIYVNNTGAGVFIQCQGWRSKVIAA